MSVDGIAAIERSGTNNGARRHTCYTSPHSPILSIYKLINETHRCFSPPESLRPRSPTTVSYLSGSESMKGLSCAACDCFFGGGERWFVGSVECGPSDQRLV